MNLVIRNRQRKVNFDFVQFKAMAKTLCEVLCGHLEKNPPQWLSRRDVRQMCSKGTVSLNITANRLIQTLNKQWRGKDVATDVLSFPLNWLEPTEEFEGMPWEIGEIFISVEKAAEQAKLYGHSLKREMAFLYVHGMLHILGFEHEEKSAAKDMFRRQKEILEQAGCGR